MSREKRPKGIEKEVKEMTPEQFTYWLKGYSEINGSVPSEYEWKMIQDHLKAVFIEITPDRKLHIDLLSGSDHLC